MNGIVADTQSVIWFLRSSAKLSSNALAALRGAIQSGGPIFISSITIVEVIYLTEKARLSVTALERLIEVINEPNSVFELKPLSLEIAEAVRQVPRDIVPEMPDRIIAATALQLGVPLVTSDRRIQASNVTTIW